MAERIGLTDDGWSVSALEPDAVAEFDKSLRYYATTLTDNFASLTVAQPEDQLKSPVGTLLGAAGSALGITVVWRSESKVDGVAGRPDLGVDADRLPVGNVELKAPGYGARPSAFPDQRSREQWERFKALPNLLYTDGREWALYRSGETEGEPTSLAFDPTHAPEGLVPEGAALLDILGTFLRWTPVVPSTPRALAEMLAPLTRVLRDEVLVDVQEGGVMARLADEWRATLFPEAGDQQFADGYAQTFTYALLLARLEGAEAPLTAESAAAALDADHALLGQALRVLGQAGTRDAIGMPVDLLERVIAAVDPLELGAGIDPWLYFYEDFLAAYDPIQRRNRGVYYTPIAIVSGQVRLANSVLVDRFGKANGFGTDGVVVLDPAAGTGTYPLSVVQQTLDQAQAHGGAGLATEVATRLARNVNAFELMVGPYAVTHLRLSRAFVDANVDLGDGVNVFLTDTLAPPTDPGFAQQATLFQERLAAEQERASIVKSPNTYVTVVIGNPPYNRDRSGYYGVTGRKKGGMIRYGQRDDQVGLLGDFLEPLPPRLRAEHGMNLYNDYVYFWRWGIWKTSEQHPGRPAILSFITASSYLEGPAFGGLREMLRRKFDELWILDLGGEGRGTRRDDNVFEGILTPVAIMIAVRSGVTTEDAEEIPAHARYRRIPGDRAAKLAAIDGIAELEPDDSWTLCRSGWQDSFLPEGEGDLSTWPPLDHLMPWTARGIQFSRSWTVSESTDVLQARWRALVAAPVTNRRALLRESRDSRVDRSYRSFLSGDRLARIDSLEPTAEPDGITRVGFRSFDRQWCIADRRVTDLPRPALWQSLSERQVYLTFLPSQTVSGPAVIAHSAVPDLNATIGSNGGLVVPLWRDGAASEPNVTDGLLDLLSEAYTHQVDPEDFLAYVFALLGTPAYTQRFAHHLSTTTLRVPLTATWEFFERGVTLGRHLLWWATFGERFRPADARGRPLRRLPAGSARNTRAVSTREASYPADYSYNEVTGVLTVGDGEFEPVSAEVWNFKVSGLRVVSSWLAYRMSNRAGRQSSELERIRPEIWTFSAELLELLAVVERILILEPEAALLLSDVVGDRLIDFTRLPAPRDDERATPRTTYGRNTQIPLFGD